MKIRGILSWGSAVLSLGLGTVAPHGQAASAPPLDIHEALRLADEYNPDLKSARAHERASESLVGVASSSYFPQLSAQAIDSAGFPGSTGALGIGGLMGSPFRSGLGAGIVLTQNLLDFGRTAAKVAAAQHESRADEKATEMDRIQVENEVVEAMMDCVLNAAQTRTWQEQVGDSALVDREVERFVDTGQRSIVDRYLARAQLAQARTNVADFGTKEEVSRRRLALLTGTRQPFRCPALEEAGQQLSLTPSPHLPNPWIEYAQEKLGASQARLEHAQAENLPTLSGIASAGYLQNAHLLPTEAYSVGVGLTIPLFEGFRVNSEIEAGLARVEESQNRVTASTFALEDLNQRYDEKLLSAEAREASLKTEYQNALIAFDVAKKRYFGFQGTLVDVRDSLANLTRVKTDLNATRTQVILTQLQKTVLNGRM